MLLPHSTTMAQRLLVTILSLLSVSTSFADSSAVVRTIHVHATDGAAPVSSAIAHAAPGDTIALAPGVYREPTIVVDKSVSVIGRGDVVLDGEGERAIMIVTARDVTISGLTFRNVSTSFVEDRAALKVDEGHNCRIMANIFENTFFAVYLSKTAGCHVEGNRITGSATSQTRAGNGVHAWYSKELRVVDNYISRQRDGIYLEFVEDAEVLDNVAVDNLRYGLHFMFSDRCKYIGNRFARNNAGVAVMYTRNVQMIGNTFEHNWGSASYGLLLKDIDDSMILENRFSVNTTAIHADGANRLVVRANDFVDNGWAIRLMANAQDNAFLENNFVGNTFDVATNSSRNYSSFGGNFWDRYQGYDLDRDGTGDVPYRPVRLFSLMVENTEPALILVRSFVVDVLDTVERILPVLTPDTLVDTSPAMRRIERRTVPTSAVVLP